MHSLAIFLCAKTNVEYFQGEFHMAIITYKKPQNLFRGFLPNMWQITSTYGKTKQAQGDIVIDKKKVQPRPLGPFTWINYKADIQYTAITLKK